MRRVDEAEEKSARLQRRKKKLLALAALGVVCVSFHGWWRKTTPPADAVLVTRTEIKDSARKAQGEIVLYVSGMVEHPGVVKVAAGARVIDGINAAGGVLPGADVYRVNLSQAVRDGMQIHVPEKALIQRDSNGNGYPASSISRDPSAKPPNPPAVSEEKININTADAAELDKLPGVGPAMAARIVEWRKVKGSFHDGGDLKKVKGIGEAKYEKLKDKISW